MSDRAFLRQAGIVPCEIELTPLEVVRLVERPTTEERLSRAYEEHAKAVEYATKLEGHIDGLLALVVVLLLACAWLGWEATR